MRLTQSHNGIALIYRIWKKEGGGTQANTATKLYTLDAFRGKNAQYTQQNSLKVEQYVDLDTHGMFICTVTEARVMSDKETMTYTYYQKNVKPNHRQKERRICLCRLRIHLRRRCLAGWLYLSALQTWSGGFWADIVRRRSRRNSAPFLCLNILILFHNQMIVAIVIQSEIIADSFIYRCECIVVFFIFWRKRNHIWDKNIVVPWFWSSRINRRCEMNAGWYLQKKLLRSFTFFRVCSKSLWYSSSVGFKYW